jgi:hypothetical protein
MSAFSGSWADIDAAKQGGGGWRIVTGGGGAYHDPVWRSLANMLSLIFGVEEDNGRLTE